MKFSRFSLFIAVLFLGVSSAAAGTAIEIEANDTMTFNKTSFEVVTGQSVTIILKNVGSLPKAAMGHNLVVLVEGFTAAEFGMKAMSAVATEYIPAELADKIVAHTKLLGPGEQDEIVFTAPAPGTYEFLCSFPGHFALMKGVMTVKAE
ncbi:MAG: cupredoxin domain-containing protein [Opitutaceae bacterium]|nr:cupredoxin domain-containing protein [Opitutaceae bacterium]